RSNLEKIIDDFDLAGQTRRPAPVRTLFSLLGKSQDKGISKEAVVESTARNISINVIGDRKAGDAFSITYTGTDPRTAMEITNALASLFIEKNLKAREQYAEGTSYFLAAELDSAKKELEKQERAIRNFKERYMGSLPQQLDANLRTLDRLEHERDAVNTELRNAEDKKVLLETQLGQAVPGAPGGQITPLAQELASLQQELAGLLAQYKESYPDIVSTRQRIREIKEMLAKSSRPEGGGTDQDVEFSPEQSRPDIYNSMVTVRSQIASLKQRLADIKSQTAMYERRVEETPANEQKLADLSRDYDISLSNYQSLLEKKLNARLSENLEKRQKGERFLVLDSANLPERPFKPNKLTVTAMGTMAGTGLAAAIIFLLEFLNPVFRKPEEIEERLNLPILTSIPRFSTGQDAAKKPAA
ncbi:MAG: GNVR domain-containing protein, partial [Deltaproteobacteria bacterium]|nr:GNVR domain-containing protein [Deltaproteobacteria bacterium]